MRQSKIENYMEQAEVVAKRSHDAETKVGSVLVKNSNGAVIANSFNGFARYVRDDLLPNTRPEKHNYIIHSEENLIANCARLGIAMDDCTLYVTMSPCKKCMRLLYQSGVTQVIAKQRYKDFDDLLKMDDIKITVCELDDVGYIQLTYSPIQ